MTTDRLTLVVDPSPRLVPLTGLDLPGRPAGRPDGCAPEAVA